MEGIAAIEPSPPPRWSRIMAASEAHSRHLPAACSRPAPSPSPPPWLSQHYTAPVMLFALLFGMAFHFLHEGGRCVAGIEFSSRTVLRLGVALLGVRITLGQIASLGIAPVATVAAGVASTILLGLLIAPRLGLGKALASCPAAQLESAALRRAGDRLGAAARRQQRARHDPHRRHHHGAIDSCHDPLSSVCDLDRSRSQARRRFHRRHHSRCRAGRRRGLCDFA